MTRSILARVDLVLVRCTRTDLASSRLSMTTLLPGIAKNRGRTLPIAGLVLAPEKPFPSGRGRDQLSRTVVVTRLPLLSCSEGGGGGAAIPSPAPGVTGGFACAAP